MNNTTGMLFCILAMLMIFLSSDYKCSQEKPQYKTEAKESDCFVTTRYDSVGCIVEVTILCDSIK